MMKLFEFTNRLQDLCHEGYSQKQIAVLDENMHEHNVKTVKVSPNGKVWILEEKNGKEKSNNED